MQIIINQSQIHDAIRNYILSQISVVGEKDIQIELKATRGDEGYTAIINIGDPSPTPTKTRGTSAAQAAKPSQASSGTASGTKASSVLEPEPTPAEPEAEVVETPLAPTVDTSENQPVTEAPVEPETKTTKSVFKAGAKPKEAANDAAAPVEEAPVAKPEKTLNFGRKPEPAANSAEAEPAAAANGAAPRSIFANMQRPSNATAA